LTVLNNFGKFRYAREITCHSIEKYTPQRFLGFTLASENVNYAMKASAEIRKELDDLLALITERCGEEFEVVYHYKVFIAVK